MPRFARGSTLSVLAALAALVLPACGSGASEGAGGGTGGGVGDGKVHPMGNGQRESQADACNALSQAQSAELTMFSCVGTTQACPDLIVEMAGGQMCLQYDQGSVQGCIAYYAQQTSCTALGNAFSDCVVTSFAGSAPMGCP